MSLADDIRASREIWVPINGHSFKIRRPTKYQVARWKDEDPDFWLRHCVVGWKDITELDLRPGGSPRTPEFDTDALCEWAQDDVEIWNGIYAAIMGELTKYWEAREDAAKK